MEGELPVVWLRSGQGVGQRPSCTVDSLASSSRRLELRGNVRCLRLRGSLLASARSKDSAGAWGGAEISAEAAQIAR